MHENGVEPSAANGTVEKAFTRNRREETDELLTAVKPMILDFISAADRHPSLRQANHDIHPDKRNGSSEPQFPALLNYNSPKQLQKTLSFTLPSSPGGTASLLSIVESLLSHSVNTWSPGFLDKLYASPHPISVVADTLLATLNTNVHVYPVAPALTLIEKQTCAHLAKLLGLSGAFAGGVSQPGGSAANMMSLVVARNSLFPETKAEGVRGRKFVLFTSEHGHYSVEKAAQVCGFGSSAVRSVRVDGQGRMSVDALEDAVREARAKGETPFYVNATAGTTVLGSFDDLDAIADVCEREGLWMHVDGSWGVAVIFSSREDVRGKLKGIERADSIAMCPHKMLNVALTCSVLLGRDLRLFQRSMTLPAGYLFHGSGGGDDDDDAIHRGDTNGHANPDTIEEEEEEQEEEEQEQFFDLGDLVPQCGRRGDILKLALSWIYYGTEGFSAYIDHGFDIAAYFASLILAHSNFTLVSENPPPCLQVCFYYSKHVGDEGAKMRNDRTTEKIKDALVSRGFMIDYAPGEEGKFFRVVVNGRTTKETVDALVRAIEDVGSGIDI